MTTATEGPFHQNPCSRVSGQRSVAGLTSKGSERASLAKIGKNSVLYLINECYVPLCKVQTRLKLKTGLLRRLKKAGVADPAFFERKASHGRRFPKIHDRARTLI